MAEQTIREMMGPPEYLAQADEEIGQLIAQFDVEAIRSMIVVDGNGPVGVIRRRDVEGLGEADLRRPVRDFMMTVPIVNDTMSVPEARQAVNATDYTADRIPVVNAEGLLVGELRRESFMREASTSVEKSARVQAGSRGDTYALEEGMDVRAVDGKKLGEIDEIMVREGSLSGFTVKHGLLGRKHKRLGGDVVKDVDSEAVTLAIGEMEFKQLVDVEDMQAETV